MEARDASADELETNEVNAGVYAFDAAWLRRRIDALTPSASNGELYLTDLVQLAREDGRIVSAVGFDDDGTLDGINDRSQLAQAEWALRVRINEAHMRAGVTMRDPSTVYVDWGVDDRHGRHARPGRAPARARRSIGEGSRHRPGHDDRRLDDRRATAASGAASSSARRSRTARSIGPYSHLRPGSHVGAGAEIGNFAEVKNSRLGARVKQHHMSYLGDADIGDGTNVGAGTITANWDGRTKNRTTRRRERLPRRRHDARRPGRGRRGREDRRRRRRHEERARRASSPSACRRGSASRA